MRFQLVRELIENITTNIKVNSPGSLFGLITFDNYARFEFSITRHTDLSTLLPAINPGLRYYYGYSTKIAHALSLLLSGGVEGGFLQLRNETSKVAIVVTDYYEYYDYLYRYYDDNDDYNYYSYYSSSSFSSLQSAANSLHAANIYDVYVVGIGNNNYYQLQSIVNDPSYFFPTYDLTNFTAQQVLEGITDHLCSG